jgi:hypothetical protein
VYIKGLLTFINSVGRRQCSLQQSLGVSAVEDGAAVPEHVGGLMNYTAVLCVHLFVCLIKNIRWVKMHEINNFKNP